MKQSPEDDESNKNNSSPFRIVLTITSGLLSKQRTEEVYMLHKLIILIVSLGVVHVVRRWVRAAVRRL